MLNDHGTDVSHRQEILVEIQSEIKFDERIQAILRQQQQDFQRLMLLLKSFEGLLLLDDLLMFRLKWNVIHRQRQELLPVSHHFYHLLGTLCLLHLQPLDLHTSGRK